MRDDALLEELLAAETEDEVLAALEKRDLLSPANSKKRWRNVGGFANNQSIILAQQSTAAAALVEKYTNAVDSILLRCCRTSGTDPRGEDAPASMGEAVERYIGDVDAKENDEIRALADQRTVLYATGKKDRPSLSLFDAGEGQLPENFPKTFCSLITAGDEGAYKKGVKFVQGQFNMGSAGVLQFCSERRKFQLILSRVPEDLAGGESHEWGYTLFCFFENDAVWRYLVDEQGGILTAGNDAMALVPRAGVPKAYEVLAPRTRAVKSGTLIKMYEYQAPRSNVCGELYRKISEYLVRPPLPMRIIECRKEYAAKVMAVTVWDQMRKWKLRNKLEAGFEDGASFQLKLRNGETVLGEIRVFKHGADDEDGDFPTGVRALINGQSHAKRDARFFRTKHVDKEHVADSILVTLVCESLRKATRNDLFMSNRETFREGPLLTELFQKLQLVLRRHEALSALDLKRYGEKVKDAVRDEDGLKALEDLLATEPSLADLFGSLNLGTVAAPTPTPNITGTTIPGKQEPFRGMDFPTFFHRGKDKAATAEIEIPRGDESRVSFTTDVKNNYFTRRKPPRGDIKITGTLTPAFALFDGHLTFTCAADKSVPEGTPLSFSATITDKRGSGPFILTVNATVVAPRVEKEKKKKTGKDKQERTQAAPSQPHVQERDLGPDQPPLKIEKNPKTGRLEIILNTTCAMLTDAKNKQPKAEAPAVEFVFKYGLALVAMSLIDVAKKTDEWVSDQGACRDKIEQSCAGIARVIVPLCLSLPKRLPKVEHKQKSHLAMASA